MFILECLEFKVGYSLAWLNFTFPVTKLFQVFMSLNPRLIGHVSNQNLVMQKQILVFEVIS